MLWRIQRYYIGLANKSIYLQTCFNSPLAYKSFKIVYIFAIRDLGRIMKVVWCCRLCMNNSGSLFKSLQYAFINIMIIPYVEKIMTNFTLRNWSLRINKEIVSNWNLTCIMKKEDELDPKILETRQVFIISSSRSSWTNFYFNKFCTTIWLSRRLMLSWGKQVHKGRIGCCKSCIRCHGSICKFNRMHKRSIGDISGGWKDHPKVCVWHINYKAVRTICGRMLSFYNCSWKGLEKSN